MPQEPAIETWEHHPQRDEYRAANDGYGMCNTGSGRSFVCMFGGHGCDVDHRFIRLLGALGEPEVRRLRLSPGDKVVVYSDERLAPKQLGSSGLMTQAGGRGVRRETALQKTAGVTRREEKSNLKSLD
jgi:hypothetical protein